MIKRLAIKVQQFMKRKFKQRLSTILLNNYLSQVTEQKNTTTYGV